MISFIVGYTIGFLTGGILAVSKPKVSELFNKVVAYIKKFKEDA